MNTASKQCLINSLCLVTRWFIIEVASAEGMATSDITREMCIKLNIIILELARKREQSLQDFNKKLEGGTVNLDKLISIVNVLDIICEQSPIFHIEQKFVCKMIY